jgi:hypothetical protein
MKPPNRILAVTTRAIPNPALAFNCSLDLLKGIRPWC